MDRGLFRSYFRFEENNLSRLQSALFLPEIISAPQGVSITGTEALCITLHYRISYPECDNFVHLLKDANNHAWLDLRTLGEFSQAVYSKAAPLSNGWGFIDGTARAFSRPSTNQKLFFSGHKRIHAEKYQAIMCPNGIIAQLNGPYTSSRHDAGILRKSRTYQKLENLVHRRSYCLYGDPAYPLRPLLLKPYGGAALNARQQAFNKEISRVRQAVECGFGKIAGLFAFLDFRKNQKLYPQNLPRMYQVSAILANCYTCMYESQVEQYFGLEPPSLETYLVSQRHY
ncbi:uncharacterized protein LOC144129190 [Amblyomma americanum]